MSEEKNSDSSLGYFMGAEAAIRERRFAEALFTLEDGLRSNYHTSYALDSKLLIGHLFGLIGLLKLSLQQNFGEEWQQEIQKGVPIHSTESLEMQCSFCGQSRDRVSKLIAGPTVNICNECVTICVEIIAEAGSE